MEIITLTVPIMSHLAEHVYAASSNNESWLSEQQSVHRYSGRPAYLFGSVNAMRSRARDMSHGLPCRDT